MFKVGESLYIERKNENGQSERFKTILVDWNETELLVEQPIHEDTKKLGLFQKGEPLECLVYMNAKVYLFKSNYIDRMNENIPLFILSFPGKEQIEIIQRRQHVRVLANLDVAVHPRNREFSPFRTITLDISGGGCALLLSQENEFIFQPEHLVDFWLVLPIDGKFHYIKTEASFVRTFKNSNQTKASFRFNDLTNSDRMQLIRYCFQRERQLKQS